MASVEFNGTPGGIALPLARPAGLPESISFEAWCAGRKFAGSRQDLVAAGVAEAGWFPGEPGQSKTMGRAMLDGRDVRVYRRRRLCEVFIYWTLRERSIYHEQEELRKALDRQAAMLAALPRSAAEFRKLAIRELEEWLRSDQAPYLGAQCKLAGGYRFTPEAIAEYEVALSYALEVLRHAPVTFDAARRERIKAAIRAKTAKADGTLQRMLRNAAVEGGAQAAP